MRKFFSVGRERIYSGAVFLTYFLQKGNAGDAFYSPSIATINTAHQYNPVWRENRVTLTNSDHTIAFLCPFP